MCPSCYAHHLMGSGGFSQLCQEAHEPVWAKVSGYPYWPAKVIREKAMQVEVQFFGDHDRYGRSQYISLGHEHFFLH